jgi:hypothetical protein
MHGILQSVHSGIPGSGQPDHWKREFVDPEGEFIPGEMILKLYYCKRLDGYVTIRGASLFRVATDYTLEAIGR